MKTNEIYKKGIEEFNKQIIGDDFAGGLFTDNKAQRMFSEGFKEGVRHSREYCVKHIKTITLDILKADIERLENTMLGGTNINRDTRVYNSALQDQIDYYQEQIKEINQQTL